jgi:D-alanine-D-alanine ligase
VLGSALSMDKIRTKQVWIANDLPTPDYAVYRPGDDAAALIADLGLPVVVKPAHEGSSVGVSRVRSPAELSAALELAARHDRELLIERLVDGAELTVAILDDVALPSIRIIPAGEYYDWHAKYVADDTQYLCPGLDGDAEAEIRALALTAFRAVGCSGWGRVDLMRDRDGRPWLLEVNTTPGMTSHSLVPKAAAAVGIDFPTLCWRILETSLRGGSR